jgi:hypothetical protein
LAFIIFTIVSALMLRQWQPVSAAAGRLGQAGIILVYAGALMGGAGFFLIFLGQDVASQYFEAAKIPVAVGFVCGIPAAIWAGRVSRKPGNWTLIGGTDRLAYFLGDGANSRVWAVPRDQPPSPTPEVANPSYDGRSLVEAGVSFYLPLQVL